MVYTNKDLIAKVHEETMLSRRDHMVDEGRTEMAENSYLIRCDQAEEMLVNKRFDRLTEIEISGH